MTEPVNPYATPSTERVPNGGPAHYAAPKRYLLISLAVLSMLAGSILPWLPSNTDLPQKVFSLHLILFLLHVLWWYDMDQRELANRPTFLFRLFLICPGPIIILPIHFLITRGVQGLKWIGIATVYLMLITLLYIAAYALSRAVLQ